MESAAPPVPDRAGGAESPGATAVPAADRRRVDRPARIPFTVPGPRPIGLLRRLVLGATLLACGAHTLWRIGDAFRFYQDDLLQFGVAQQSGLSWDLLGLNVFQHFAPVNRFAHLFLVRFADFSVGAGAVLATTLVLCFLASMLWLLHELGASFAARLLSLVAVGLSITVLDTAVWADAALHILPALVATNLVVAAHVRAVRTGRWRWHVLAVVVLAAGVLTQERVLFALPLVVLVDWFLLGSGRSVADRWRLLRSVLLPLAAMTVLALAAAVFIWTNYVAGVPSARPSIETTARTALGALTEGLAPPWVGVRLEELSPLPVQLAVLAVVALVAGVLVWIRRTNADALLFLLATFVLYYGFLAFSPILRDDFVGATALRLHNGAYLLVPTVAAVTRLRLRRRTAEDLSARRLDSSWVAVPIAAVLGAALVLAGGRFTHDTWEDGRDAHAYLDAVARTEGTWSGDDVTVVPLMAPPTIGRDWAEYYARHEFFLRYYSPGFVPQQLGDRPIVLDADGRPRPVELVPEGTLGPVGASTCDAPARTALDSATPVAGEPLFLRLTYRTGAAMDLRVTSTQGLTPDAAPFGNWAVPLAPGEHTVVVPLHSTRPSSLLLDWSVPGAEHCVLAADVVRPVFSDGGVCEGMDRYGNRTGTTACPPTAGGRRSPSVESGG